MEHDRPGFTSNDSFCIAPWATLHLDALGQRRLCCVSELAPPEASEMEYTEFFHSKYMKGIRAKMMSGQMPEECHGCVKPNRSETYKDFLNGQFRDLFEKVEKQTGNDGAISGFNEPGGIEIAYLDYRSNRCNLRCKTCGPESSSAWESEIQRHSKQWGSVYSAEYLDGLRTSVSASRYDTEFLEIVKSSPLRKIYFAGGEPLIEPKHWEVLDYLIQSGRAPEISLAYNTNLSLPAAKMDEFVAKISFFKEAIIYCSIDGAQATTEYIRTGMNFPRFAENVKVLHRSAARGRIQVWLDLTITSLTFLELRELSEMAIDLGAPLSAKIMLHGNRKAKFLRCEFLPEEIRRKLALEWRDYFDTLPLEKRKLLGAFGDTLKIASELAQFKSMDYPRILSQIELNDQAFPKGRKFSHFLLAHSECSEWYRSMQAV